ncbi:MAG TPA: hypothetical protein PK251_01205 [Candidatus Latescibacteria bacterium]|nr:hypothetical protein [Candidatus Latescibacterota bacterium]HOS63356.1 hypothetical protein [Candidatus Latescibacterota bacterium]HPK74461.1 hypothetical protein [Candidatus Latescibacterota bacterium]
MPRTVTNYQALRRLALSLANWSEAPPRVLLRRGDSVRFAHAIALLGLQLMQTAGESETSPAGSSRESSVLVRDGFAERVQTMVSLADREHSATLAEELVSEAVESLCAMGIAATSLRFAEGAVRGLPLTPREVDASAEAFFVRAKPLGVVAALVADSYARGCADSASDLDVRLLAHEIPDPHSRLRAFAPLADRGIVRQYPGDDIIHADQMVIAGRRVDLRFHTIRSLEVALQGPFIPGGAIEALELLQNNRIVLDPQGIATGLVRRSDLLAQRAREIATISLSALREWDEATVKSAGSAAEAMVRTLGPGLEYLIRAWAGLNGRVHAFPRWVDAAVLPLPVSPRDGRRALQQLVTSPWTAKDISARLSEWKTLSLALSELDHPL